MSYSRYSYSRLFSQKLTELSNYYADWSRTSELFFSQTHRYTFREMIPRGFIISFTALSGFLGAHFHDEENSQFSSLAVGIAAALAGLVVSHTLVSSPLLYKRYLVRQECVRLVAEINAKLDKMDDRSSDFVAVKKLILSLTEVAQAISLSDEHAARASHTWRARRRMLESINNCVTDNLQETIAFWKVDKEELIGKLAVATPEKQSIRARF